ncbi:hypothetical protein [Leptospira weilii]|uniref:hypothetical protein n=1 Tax=Leptospira weilii TaxID=28184 RepID=UPI000A6D294C|nr:hypothetical protein [Leptospira weilii]
MSSFRATYLATLRERDLSLGSVVPEFSWFWVIEVYRTALKVRVQEKLSVMHDL